MKNENQLSRNQLVQPATKVRKTIDGKEVSLEELESLCTNFDRRPRGCNAESSTLDGGFTSAGDNDDVLF
ncbi:hypothetical protein SanaruYs_34850 [Chryseotalea sanaruensis]|uniref:Uncharacterized protein n=1 Tax=Chryseotalea sanaruensis TaxID=2482724 RepID=A0A401UEF8_9BACT|nr:hypothetical protein [Chryseotalea sanaruensis]GCC53242.1 hypothetical protein SanaruYs_34850 [Chryseotalea sanaruensis]